jgi:hypothetical protein
MPENPMTPSEKGKLGGKLGAAARVKSLGPERVKEIAAKARAARWAKYYERKAKERDESIQSDNA